MTDQKRYRAMLKALGWKTKDVANITRIKYSSLRSCTSPRGKFPRHFLLALEVFEHLTKNR